MTRAALILCLFLGGCVTPIASPAVCPPVTPWSPQEQQNLALALQPFPGDSPLWMLEKDWQTMRDDLRACQK